MSDFFERSYENMFMLVSVSNIVNSVVISKNYSTLSSDMILFLYYL